jgi:beta-lactam-binding protein with PASTA domain/tRNA A-37 threonylcarbamoyl transferase component Bud32
MPPPDQLIGALFDGRYKILKRLGAGGMATVYLAEDQELGRRVAIKILNAKHASDEQFVERFRREASSAAALSHPNIVSIYDRGEAEGTYYIAMEVIDGRSLKELLLARGPSPIPVAVNYARQILSALRFAHRNGVVHRDIKPHNVLVDEEGRVKVTDFGIARAGASEMTEVGSIIGTAQYLSPEQARGAPVDQRSDIYSVGVVLYELLTGEAPYNGETPVEIAMKHLSAIPEPPSTKRPEVPPELDAVVLRALAKNPDDRYQTVEEMDADLSAISKGMEISETTTEAATTVLAGAGLTAPTTISRAPTRVVPPGRPAAPVPPVPPSGYYDLGEPPPRRPVWPWLLALVLAASALGVVGWIVNGLVNEDKPVAVPLVAGIRYDLAVDKIKAYGLVPDMSRKASETVAKDIVISQRPTAGDRVLPGSKVQIVVSSGKQKLRLPSVIGLKEPDAIKKLQDAGFDNWSDKRESSPKPEGTVIDQDPAGNSEVAKGTKVVLTISSGPKQINVPNVIDKTYAQASAELKGLGFKVAREDVESSEPQGIVIGQDPPSGSTEAEGSTVTLTVSKGPSTVTVPDVTSNDLDTAIATLESAGFAYRVTYETTTDINEDGIVLDQNPPGFSEAKPGTTIVLTVGQYEAPTTTAGP